MDEISVMSLQDGNGLDVNSHGEQHEVGGQAAAFS